jgi:hypothetical protein
MAFQSYPMESIVMLNEAPLPHRKSLRERSFGQHDSALHGMCSEIIVTEGRKHLAALD